MNSPFPGVRASRPAASSPPTPSPDWPPPDHILLHAIRAARACKPNAPTQPIFKFRTTMLAAKFNMEILHQFNYNVHAALTHDKDSPLHPGCEFRPVSILAPVFEKHPNWKHICSTLTLGGHHPLFPLSADCAKSDLQEGMAFGNHKSAVITKEWIMHALSKETEKGWQLPLPADELHKIPRALVAPLGNAKQTTINAQGDRILKN